MGKIKLNKELCKLIVVITIMIGVYLVLNALTPMIADDFAYKGSQGLIDILINEYQQYMSWSGRSVAHIITRFFLMYRGAVFDVANSIVTVAFFYLICFNIQPQKRVNIFILTFSAFVFFLLTPDYGQIFLWLTGACNYLWTMTSMLLFLLPYSTKMSNGEVKLKGIKMHIFSVMMLIGGVIAGWCNENTSGGVLLLVIGSIAWELLHKKKVPMWMILGLLGNSVGLAFMVLAPGNVIRSGNFSVFSMNISQIMTRWQTVTTIYLQYFLPATIIILFIIIFMKISFEKYMPILYVLFVSYATVAVLLISPGGLGGRGLFGALVFLYIAVIKAVLLIDKANIEMVLKCIYMCVLLLFLPAFIYSSLDIYRTYTENIFRQTYVNSQKEQGNMDIIVGDLSTPLTKQNAFYGLDELGKEGVEWMNKPYAEQNEINSISSIPYGQWVKAYSYGETELISCVEFEDYMVALNQDKYIFSVTLKNTSENTIPGDLKEVLVNMGLTELADNLDAKSYSAIVQNGKDIEQEISTDTSKCEIESPIQINAISEFDYLNAKTYQSFLNQDYTIDLEGLNIVVFSIERNVVVDMVNFDLYETTKANRYIF